MAMQSQQHQQTRPDSPSDNSFNPSFAHHNLKPSIHTADPLFNIHSQQSPNHAMFNNIHIPSDYSSELEKQSSTKMNGFAPYRASASFSSFPNNNRPRHPTTSSLGSSSYRDAGFYPTASDIFPSGPPLSHMTSPTLQQHQLQQNSYDLHPSRGFDYTGSQQSNLSKQSYGLPDPFANGPSSALLQSHQVGSGGGKSLHSVQQQHNGYQSSFVNGLHIQSQTPYGPHLQTNGATVNGAAGSGPASINHVNGGSAALNPSQEEISTIFVVGFPEDMQEREFQNMFTFSAGFEAATLKIPNKEYNAYGGTAAAPPGGSMRPGANGLVANYPQPYSGSNDPYNLVTVNQGGVVVDGGRDGTMASWPASVPGITQDDSGGHFASGGAVQSMPPRKQIIGFAKFRSRPEALEARDVLQGRRVDIEKGAVLKAEMAKKNLHTKRGVGPLPMPTLPSMSGGGGGVGPSANETLGPVGGMGGVSGLGGGAVGESLTVRERELGSLGSVGMGGLNQWRDTSRIENNRADEEERERKRDREAGVLNAMGLGATRGPRERAEEDERERERRRKEKEARLRSSGMTAFDAFHSVPPVISRHTSTSTGMLSPGSGSTDNGAGSSPMMNNGFSHSLTHSSAQEEVNESAGPWDGRKMSMTLSATPTVPLSRQSSPSSRDQENTSTFSPSANNNAPLPQRMFSPSLEEAQRYTSQESSQYSSQEASQYPLNKRPTISSSSKPASSASSVTGGSQSSHVEGDVSRGFGGLAVTTNHGNTSPQLPSPASGASSTSTRNIVDQNPPINTLYVGNLPTSQVPSGYPPNYLEDSLRELFQRRPGFRKLCFRQKSNGPMCFVEFEDVSFATKTLNDLYGNTLGGLIKGGGIRLSYSKNPLGVRTPTSAGSNGPSLQQQQLQSNQPSGGGTSPFASDAFQSRQSVDTGVPSSRRETAVTSPPPSYSYMMSSPPPRFFSPTPSGNTSTFPRANQQVHGYAPTGNSSLSSFSPFGASTLQHSTIPDRTSSDPHDHHFAQGVLSSNNNIEAARAG